MAFTPTKMAVIVAFLGVVSFICGIYAETKKPPAGKPIAMKGGIICTYPSDPTVILGYLSAAFLTAATAAGYFSLFYPYKGKSIPQAAAYGNSMFTTFFCVSLGTTGLAATLLLWPTITEHLHLVRNVHRDLETDCMTAKTGVLGGGAFAALDASFFWLFTLILATNVREDYFEDAAKSEYSNVVVVDH